MNYKAKLKEFFKRLVMCELLALLSALAMSVFYANREVEWASRHLRAVWDWEEGHELSFKAGQEVFSQALGEAWPIWLGVAVFGAVVALLVSISHNRNRCREIGFTICIPHKCTGTEATGDTATGTEATGTDNTTGTDA